MLGLDRSIGLRRSQPVAGVALRAVWTCVRFPAVTLLVMLEPVVGALLSALALLLALTALFLEAVSSRPIPFWGMLSVAVGAVAAQVVYRAVIRALS